MDLQRIVTILLRRWWLVLGMPALVLAISLVLLTTSPWVASMRASVLIPGDTQETGNAERPELMVLDDIPQIVSSPAFANAISAQLQQTSPEYALSTEQIQVALSADYYSRIVTIRATRDDEQEALALLNVVQSSLQDQVNFFLISAGGQPATVRLVAPPSATRDSPATGTVALIIQTLVALGIGCGLAALAAAFDQRIHSRSDAAAVIPVPVLGDLRSSRRSGVWWRRRSGRPRAGSDDALPAAAPSGGGATSNELLRGLRATLDASRQQPANDDPASTPVWMFAAVEGEGEAASTLARRYGQTCAAAGERCLIFDAARSHEPTDDALFDDWLASGDDTLPPLPVPEGDGSFQVVGIMPLRGGRDLMRGRRWDVALTRAQAAYDVVVISVRPVGSSADGLALAAHVEAIVLLVTVGRTNGSTLVQARAALLAAGGRVAGTVLGPAE